MATTSCGWAYISTQNQTGGRQATISRVVGSQPERPPPVARNSRITPTMRNSQTTYPVRIVGQTALPRCDQPHHGGHRLRTAVTQHGPQGKGTLPPTLATKPMLPAMIGYTGAAKVEMLNGCGGYMHTSCP